MYIVVLINKVIHANRISHSLRGASCVYNGSHMYHSVTEWIFLQINVYIYDLIFIYFIQIHLIETA